MKQTKIIAFLALAFILGVATPVVGITVANNVSAVEQVAAVEVNSLTDLADKVADETVTQIKLMSNISGAINIERTAPLTIDLNGYTLSNTSDATVMVRKGNITFTGTGSISASGSGSAIKIAGAATSSSNYAVVNVGENITLQSAAMYGIAVSDTNNNGKSYGVVVNLNGKIVSPYGITVRGNILDSVNAPKVNIGNTAVIEALTEEDSTPIYAAGAAEWTIGSAAMTGKAAIAMKAGKLTFNNTEITIDGITTNPDVTTGSIEGNNSVFQIEHNSVYADSIVINVNGGKYTSVKGDVFYEYGLTQQNRSTIIPADINISGGTFVAASGKKIFGGDTSSNNIQITGGTFSGTDVNDFKTNGYLANNLTVDENGKVVAVKTPSRPAQPDDSDEPETPGTVTPDTPSGNKPEDNQVPNTGVISNQGIINAISTTIPLVIMAGIAFIWFNRHMVKVRRAEREIEEERERRAKAYIPKVKREATIDHFVAEPIEHRNPDGPMVDMFVK